MVDIGELAPDLELRDQHMASHRLSSHRGSDNVLLVFFPFAFTGVCTGEMVALRDALPSLSATGTAVYAISCDSVPTLRRFDEQEQLGFSLLSDFWPHGAVSTSYGVFNDMIGSADRASFVIDRQGVVRWLVRNDISDARAVADYEKALAEL